MSILGLDVGHKRIGVAVTDELDFMAHAVGFIKCVSEPETIEQIQKTAAEHRVSKIVVGLPKTLKGETGTQAKKVLAFADSLAKQVACPVVTWDERLTTAQAERALLAQDMSRAKRRLKRDQIAAEIMLQSYLDFIKQKG